MFARVEKRTAAIQRLSGRVFSLEIMPPEPACSWGQIARRLGKSQNLSRFRVRSFLAVNFDRSAVRAPVHLRQVKKEWVMPGCLKPVYARRFMAAKNAKREGSVAHGWLRWSADEGGGGRCVALEEVTSVQRLAVAADRRDCACHDASCLVSKTWWIGWDETCAPSDSERVRLRSTGNAESDQPFIPTEGSAP